MVYRVQYYSKRSEKIAFCYLPGYPRVLPGLPIPVTGTSIKYRNHLYPHVGPR